MVRLSTGVSETERHPRQIKEGKKQLQKAKFKD